MAPTSSKDKVALPRGEACLQCRRRKLRCDAVKPACSKCIKSGRGDACEYQDTHYLVTIQTLEEQVRALTDRLTQFEHTGGLLAGAAAANPLFFQQHLLGALDDDPSRLPTSLPFSAFLGGPGEAMPQTPMGMPPRPQPISFASSGSIITLASVGSNGAMPGTPLSVGSSSSPVPLPQRPARPQRSMSISSSLSSLDGSIGVGSLGSVGGMTTMGSPGGLGSIGMGMHGLTVGVEVPQLGATIGSSGSRNLLRTFAAHAARFGFPRHSLERLPHVTPALLEAVYAVACRVGGPASLGVSYEIDTRALERSFIHRAEVALSRPDENGSGFLALELVQAQALLAQLLYILDRPLDAHRHAGGALRLATTLRLQHSSVADERAETWWMVFALDRAWSGVYGVAPSSIDESAVCAPFPGVIPLADSGLDGGRQLTSALEMLYAPPTFGIETPDPGMGMSGETLGAARFKVLALHARAHELISNLTLGQPLPPALMAHAGVGVDPFGTTILALERLVSGISMIPRGPASATVRLEALASVVALYVVMGNNDAAMLAARSAIVEVAGLTPADIDMLDPIVPFCLASIHRAWRELHGEQSEIAPVERVLERMCETLPYLMSHRSPDDVAQTAASMLHVNPFTLQA